MAGMRILAVRLGAMGDIIHTLPAVATLKHSFPHCQLYWAVEPKWAPLLEGNPFLDQVIFCTRNGISALLETRKRLRAQHFDFAVDFQGLIKSALVASAARPEKIFGYHSSQAREKVAALFYSKKVRTNSEHVVDRHLELAASTGASNIVKAFPLPQGTPEGSLPAYRIRASLSPGRLGRQAVAAYILLAAGPDAPQQFQSFIGPERPA